ncbi:Serine/arginine repetitive matrix protein 2-like protein [Drosera capensis]
MYNGIGLQTPRGSGTNGHVQTNKFFIRPKTSSKDSKSFGSDQGTAGLSKKPNKEILEHDRKRQIELKLLVLEDKLVEQGYTETEIEERLAETRRVLEAADEKERDGGGVVLVQNKSSETQTHQIAARKEKQMEKLGAALGIDYQADDDAEFEEGEIQRGRGNKGTKNGRQLKEEVNTEEVDQDRSLVVERNAADGDKLIEKEPKRMKDNKRIVVDDSSDSNSRSGDDTDSSVSRRRGSPVKKTKKRSGTVSKKRHDTDSESDSVDGRQKYSYAKSHKRSGTASKKRHDSGTETDSEGDSESDSDSQGDSRKDKTVRNANKTKSSRHDDKQEVKRKQVDMKRRKVHESSDSESERSLESDADDVSEKLHRKRGMGGRRSTHVVSKAGRKSEGRKPRHDSESSDSDRKSNHVEDSESDLDVRTKRRATLKESREAQHKNSDDSDFNRYDPRKLEVDDRYLTAYESRNSTGMSEHTDRFEKLSQHAEKAERDTREEKDRERSSSHRTRTGTVAEDHKTRTEREHKRSGEGSRDYGLEADHETNDKRSIQGRHGKPRESDKNVDDGARLGRKDIVDNSVKGRNRGSSPPDSRTGHNSGRPKTTDLDDESGRYTSRPDSYDDGKAYHENEEPKQGRDKGRDKYKDEEVRKERGSKKYADDKGRSKYSGHHIEEEEQRYSNQRRADETHEDGGRKRGRKEDAEGKSRRDEWYRDTSKRSRYDDSHPRDSSRYESDKHDSCRSRH